MVVVLIIVMVTVLAAFVAIALVAWMVVTALATMMPVVQKMAASDRKISCVLLLSLFCFLELAKDTSCSVSSLALLAVLFISMNLNLCTFG
jgi:hypothetical protein